ncbi:MAG: histidine kinase [Eubacteriales bacterium]
MLEKMREKFGKIGRRGDSFGARVYMSNLLIVLIGIGIVFVCFTVYNVSILHENTQIEMQTKAESTLREIEGRINMLDTIAIQISSSPIIIDSMKAVVENEGNDFVYDIQTAYDIYENLWSYIIDSDSANSVSIYNNSGDYIYTGEGMTFSTTTNFAVETELLLEYVNTIEAVFEDESVYKLVMNKGEDDENGYYQGDAIAVIRPIKGSLILNSSAIAYVEVCVSLDDIQEILVANVSEEEQYILYASDTGVELCSTASMDIGDIAYEVEVEMEDFVYTLVLYKSSNQEMQLIRSTIITFIVLYIFLITCLSLVQRKVTDGIMSPLVSLCSSVSNIDEWKEQKYLSDISSESNREVRELTEAFSGLISKLEHSINENVMAKTGEATAHLFALQAQMNPHFIHNTLAIIQAYAGEENYAVVDEICERLSEMIRYSSDYRDHRATLTSEVGHANNYMQLMKLRYEEDLIFELDNRMEDLKVMVPCFIIQPILENCIAHGLVKKAFPWKIEVTIVEIEGYWEIVIQDNGQGIPPEYGQEIISYVDGLKSGAINILNEKLSVGGLSIKNVIGRLYLEYGNEMKFLIRNSEEGGAQVTIGGKILN